MLKPQLDSNNYLNENEIGLNRDIDNTIFLMNFELMNLCDNKNLQILDLSNEINGKFINISNLIMEKTNILKEHIKNDYLNFISDEIISKFDDFYWDVKMRCEKYNEHISEFKKTIFDIFKINGSFDKLKDLLSLFDSKNHKGKDVLFNQPFFIKMNDLSSLKSDRSSRNLFKPHGKTRSSSKKRFIRQNSQNSSLKEKEIKKKEKNKINKLLNKGDDRYNRRKLNNICTKNGMRRSNSNLFDKNKTLNSSNNTLYKSKDDIVLDQRILQRFFAYSIIDFYSKNFKIINFNDDTNCEACDSQNIYYINYKRDEFNNNSNTKRKKC